VINVYTAPAGTPTADALKLLASWAASQEDLATETVAAGAQSVASRRRP
jgi:hypothetical protein